MMRRLLSLTACLVAAGTIAACAQQEPVVGEGASAVDTTYLVINEFTSGSSGRVEVYNPTASALSIAGWSIDDVAGGGAAPKVLVAGTSVPAGGVLSISYGGINTASLDSVRLVDGAGVEIDAHDNFHSGSSDQRAVLRPLRV